MTLLRTFVIVITYALLACVNGTAQPWSIDAHVGGFAWTPWSSFRDVSGIPAPQRVTFQGDNTSRSVTASIGADYTHDSLWSIGGSLLYRPAIMSYTASERAPIALPGGGIYTATLQHDIQADITTLALAPHVRYRVLPWLTAQLSVPLHLILRARYTQVMRFADPVGLTFVDGQLEQITGRGNIANQRLLIPSIAFHMLADLPLNTQRNLSLVPRIGYQASLASLTKDGAYTLQGIEASIGVRYTLGWTATPKPDATPVPRTDTTLAAQQVPSSIVYDTRVERDTIVELRTGIAETSTSLISSIVDTVSGITPYRRLRETYKTLIPKPPAVLRGSIVMQFIEDDGNASNNARLTATRVVSRRSVPLVPFVVFDSDSTTIPNRYSQLSQKQATSWNERSVVAADKHWHYELLNIIGSRMRASRTATCQLQMYTSASDTVRGNAMLNAVRAYIVNRYGISEQRIEIVPSSKGLAENDVVSLGNTVVISDPTGAIVQPLEGTVNFVEARLPTVRITPDAISEAGLSSWDVVLRQEQQEKHRIHDSTGELHEVTVDLNDVMSADAAMKTPLSFELQLHDVEGTSMTSEPIVLKLTSKALRQSERATPLKRTELLRVLRGTTQQSTQVAGHKVIDNPPWATKGLQDPELGLYEQGTRVYIHEERRP